MKIVRSMMMAAAVGAASLVWASAASAQGSPAPAAPAVQPADKPADKPAQPAEATKPENKMDSKATEPAASEEKLVYVKMTTSKGDVIMELNNEKAPISVKNFLAYVDDKFYDGTIFHRVIPNFMIQGGGFTADMTQKPTKAAIKNEWKNGLQNKKGAIAMARTRVADSATSQFFINVVDNPFLDQPNDGAAYAVFGKVIGGMDVVEKIRTVKTGQKGGHGDVPTESVTIVSMTRMTADEAKAAAGVK